jgi:hypothetical protein
MALCVGCDARLTNDDDEGTSMYMRNLRLWPFKVLTTDDFDILFEESCHASCLGSCRGIGEDDCAY